MKIKLIMPNMFLIGLLILSVSLIVNSNDAQAQEATLVPMDPNGTEWDVEMVYVSSSGKKDTSEDKFIFKDRKFISEEFKDKGYEPTNYSLTAKADGLTDFGTMQILGKETLFWKGTVDGNEISGSVYIQPSSGKTKTGYFTGKKVSGTLKPEKKRVPKFPDPVPLLKSVAPVQPPVDPAESVPSEEAQDVVEMLDMAENAANKKEQNIGE